MTVLENIGQHWWEFVCTHWLIIGAIGWPLSVVLYFFIAGILFDRSLARNTAKHEAYLKSPQYKLDLEEDARKWPAEKKLREKEEAQRLIRVAQLELGEELDFQEMRRQVLTERGDFVLSAEEEALKRRLLDKVLGRETVSPAWPSKPKKAVETPPSLKKTLDEKMRQVNKFFEID